MKGAAYAVIDEKDYFVPGKTILVDDVLKTLQNLASIHRKKLSIPILAVTGSNGKTTTKELISAVLSQKFKVSFTHGNLNNHIGLPLTLLGMTENTEFGIVEMGANHPGEINTLCSISDPDYGTITNIGKAHLEGFGSFDAIKKTKAELYEYIKNKQGTIFFNRDNTVLKELTKNITNKVSYGQRDAYLTGEPLYYPPFIGANINFPGKTIRIKTKLTGKYNFENLMAAACIGQFFGIEPLKIKEALQNFQPRYNRSQLIEKSGLKIVMDAYNANPTSMEAAIDSFISGFTSPQCIILGDMLELGPHSVKEHISILKKLPGLPFKEIFLVGPIFSIAAKNFPYKTYSDTDSLCRYLSRHPVKDCALLIKGSRGIQLEKILDYL